mmetsp:Transcript_148321/g.413154  ORF Transcript_148321/g.413154 Transcript_148321/m.413154 type:complete len:279 (+) Transcript_148321:574-1410(+)
MRRHIGRIIPLGDRPQGVLQQFEGDVVQVLADEREADLPRINHIDGGGVAIVILAEPCGVACCVAHDADRVAIRVDHRGGATRPRDRQVLRGEDVCANPRREKIVQELVDLVIFQSQGVLHGAGAPHHVHEHVGVPPLDVLQYVAERLRICLGDEPKPSEGIAVQGTDHPHVREVVPLGQGLDEVQPPREAYGQLLEQELAKGLSIAVRQDLLQGDRVRLQCAREVHNLGVQQHLVPLLGDLHHGICIRWSEWKSGCGKRPPRVHARSGGNVRQQLRL